MTASFSSLNPMANLVAPRQPGLYPPQIVWHVKYYVEGLAITQ